MLSFASLLVFATSAFVNATPLVERRDAGADLLISDLLDLDRAIRTITTAANSYQGPQDYEAIQESFIEVNRTNRIAYYDGLRIKPQNIKDSNRIIAVVTEPITPDIDEAVNALIAKRDLIKADGFSKETARGLNLISYDHDTLSIIAVAPKLNVLTVPAATPPVLAIDLDWRRGVAAFGGVPLAPLTGGELAGDPLPPSIAPPS